MASSRKKAILRTVDDAVHCGYLPLSGIIDGPAHALIISLLDLEGRTCPVPFNQVRHVAFVRDFNPNDPVDPERLSRRVFLARPRAEGLWVRLTLTAGDPFEGLAPLDLALVDGLLEDRGLFLIPPDMRSNTQRLYVPSHSISALQILAVITTPSKVKPVLPAKTAVSQPSLFPER